MKATPRVMPITPSVAMKGGSLMLTISTEVTRPEIKPIDTPAARLAASGQSCATNRLPVTTPESAITAPGARSMPPEMITTAAPTAAMP